MLQICSNMYVFYFQSKRNHYFSLECFKIRNNIAFYTSVESILRMLLLKKYGPNLVQKGAENNPYAWFFEFRYFITYVWSKF